MQTDHRDEIAASLGAQQTLGPGYDQVLAEGLVERIGDEIDQRIEARLDRRLAADPDGWPGSQAGPHVDCRHARRAERRAMRRGARAGRPSVLLPLGSMTAGILASLTVLLSNQASVATGDGFTKSAPGGGAIMLTALIWVVIAIINVVHAHRRS